MSTDIILIIVGAVFILLALADTIKPKNSTLNLINSQLRVPLGIIGILLIIYGGYSYGAIYMTGQIEPAVSAEQIQPKYPIEKVQVLSPLNGDSVDCRILTKGVYPDSNGNDIWVLLKPSDNKYYPQSDHTNTSYKRNGKWQVITRFGGDQGELFEVIVYQTDSAASQYFSETIVNWQSKNAYPGLMEEELPEGAVEVDRIQVYQKENCRGAH